MILVGIDPGSEETGWAIVGDDYSIINAAKVSNQDFLDMIYSFTDITSPPILVCESIQSYGMTMGKSTIETCYMIGRIIEASKHMKFEIFLYPRPQYGKAITCGPKVNDALIRTALEVRFGSYDPGKKEKRLKNGTIKQAFVPEGPLHKLSGASDKRSAFAVACYFLDQAKYKERS